MRKHALKTLGVSLLAALGLMAFAVASAQAGEIQILNPPVGKTAAELATGKSVTGTQEGAGKLLVPALHIYVECKKFSVIEGTITSGPAGEALGKLVYEECKSFSEAGEELPCVIEDGGLGGVHEHITATAKIKVILHHVGTEADMTYLLAEKDSLTGNEFFAKFRNGGELCNLPRNIEIKGSTVLKIAAGTVGEPATGDLLLNNGAGKVEPLVESSAAICALFETAELGTHVLLYGANTSCIDGSAKLKINTMSHENIPWGAK